jgi:hypothetical protein
MPGIDGGIDDSNCDIATKGQLVSLWQAQLVRGILRYGWLGSGLNTGLR